MAWPRPLAELQAGLSSALAWEALRDAAVLWEGEQGTYDREVAAWRAVPRRRAPSACGGGSARADVRMPLVPHIVRHDLQQFADTLARPERVSGGLSLEAYRAGEVKRAACERFLEQTIQECIHINEHVARREWGVGPTNAHEGFRL